MNKKNFFVEYKSIVAFLILEVLALLSFTFADINDVLFLAGVLISSVAFVFAFFTNNNKKDFIKIIPPLIILLVVSAIAGFGGLAHSYTTLSNIAVFLAIPGFFGLGFFTRRLGEIKIEYVLMAIGFGMAAVTLIGTFATWISYGPFYSLIYKIKDTTNYYYNGAPYDVTKEMSWLFGFGIEEAAINYGGTFAIICAAYLPSVIFINRKENRNMFISAAIIGGIGTISIFTIPNFKAVGVLVAVIAFCLIYKNFKNTKTGSIFGWCFVGVVGLGVLFFLLAIINAASGFVFPGFLNRLFVSNELMKGPSDVLRAAFDKTVDGKLYNFFGFDLNAGSSTYLIGLNEILWENTGIFEIQLVKEIGIFGAIIFVLFLCAMIYFVARYLKQDVDSESNKITIVSVLFAFFAYSSIANEIMPSIHNTNYGAFLRSVPLMICLFLLGFLYFVPNKKEEDK